MDAFRLSLALVPLGVYLLLLAGIHLSGRPWLTTGGRDTVALGIALCGLVLVGPMELFLPEAAAGQFGHYIWLLMLSFYALTVALWVLLARPRLVVYNVALAELRTAVEKVVAMLDPDARWAGESVLLPRLGVQLHLDVYRPMRTASLIAIGDEQSFGGWRVLREMLAAELRNCPPRPHSLGVTLGLAGLLLSVYPIYQMWRDPAAVALHLAELLRL